MSRRQTVQTLRTSGVLVAVAALVLLAVDAHTRSLALVALGLSCVAFALILASILATPRRPDRPHGDPSC